jgi:prepilin-type N-terminal cleavage/methylation domain-containing protein
MAQTREHGSVLKKSPGFTLIELLVTVGILAFGIVTVYEALFISMDTFGYYVNYLEIQDWIDGKIAEQNQALMQAEALEPGEASGRITRNHKTFQWNMVTTMVDEEQKFYQLEITLSWHQGSKTVKISRTAYLLPPQLKSYEEKPV